METLPREIGGRLPWLTGARWFGEAAAADRIRLVDAARVPPSAGGEAKDESAWAAIIDVSRPGGGTDRFFLPLAIRGESAVDAACHERFVAWLLAIVRDGGSLAAGGGRFCGHAMTGTGPGTLPAGTLSIREIGGDASNTTLLVESGGCGVVIKIVRRCRAGIHPEVEVGEFLGHARVRVDVPRLLGWLSHEPRSLPAGGVAEPPTVLAVVHERIDSRGSAWDTMRDWAVGDWPRCLAMAASLGETTARLHAALSCRDDSPDFSPEPWTPDAWQAAIRRMAGHAEDVIDRMNRRLPGLPPEAARDLARLVERRAALGEAFANAASPPREGRRIRVHGDYHLGQVLVAHEGDRCVVIDFEGEPARPLDERRERTSAAKDVAGMCRSFDYLLRVLAKEGRRPHDPRDLASLESRFLAGYESASRSLAAAGPVRRWWPDDRREAAWLVRLFKLDKAVYELAYEADHRPGWIDVPLAAIEGLLAP